MEQTNGESNATKKFTAKRRSFKGGIRTNSHENHYQHHQLLQYSGHQFGFCNQNYKYQRYYPALLPLPFPIPLQLALTPPFPQNQSFKSKTHFQKSPCKLSDSPFAASSENKVYEGVVASGTILIYSFQCSFLNLLPLLFL